MNNTNNKGNQRRDCGGEHFRVLRGRNNHQVVIVENSSSEEEEPYEEGVIDHVYQNNHDYRVNVNIPVFYGTMKVYEFLDWQIDVDGFFDVTGVSENKQVKIIPIKMKSTANV